MTEQGLATTAKKETGMQRIKSYMLSAEVKERFSEMMGPNALYYLNQVLILVANDDKLQECSPQSVLISAMRAASLRLSVDKSKGQAWIIPYGKEAQFQLGYKGVYELAQRTGKYRFINVFEIFEGDILSEDRMTGMHSIEGRNVGNPIVGWMLYFQLNTGFEKTFYMTVDEIESHARHYSKAYQYDLAQGRKSSKWSDPYERAKMEKKTVLSNGLRRWGVFGESDIEILDAIETEQGWTVDLPEEPTPEKIEAPKKTAAQLARELGIDEPDPAPAPEPAKPAETVDAETGEILTWAQTIIEQMKMYANRQPITEKQKGMLAPILENALAPGDVESKRHAVLKALTGHTSLKEVDNAVASQMWHWLKPYTDSGGAWCINEESGKTLGNLIAELDAENQPSLI